MERPYDAAKENCHAFQEASRRHAGVAVPKNILRTACVKAVASGASNISLTIKGLDPICSAENATTSPRSQTVVCCPQLYSAIWPPTAPSGVSMGCYNFSTSRGPTGLPSAILTDSSWKLSNYAAVDDFGSSSVNAEVIDKYLLPHFSTLHVASLSIRSPLISSVGAWQQYGSGRFCNPDYNGSRTLLVEERYRHGVNPEHRSLQEESHREEYEYNYSQGGNFFTGASQSHSRSGGPRTAPWAEDEGKAKRVTRHLLGLLGSVQNMNKCLRNGEYFCGLWNTYSLAWSTSALIATGGAATVALRYDPETEEP